MGSLCGPSAAVGLKQDNKLSHIWYKGIKSPDVCISVNSHIHYSSLSLCCWHMVQGEKGVGKVTKQLNKNKAQRIKRPQSHYVQTGSEVTRPLRKKQDLGHMT